MNWREAEGRINTVTVSEWEKLKEKFKKLGIPAWGRGRGSRKNGGSDSFISIKDASHVAIYYKNPHHKILSINYDGRITKTEETEVSFSLTNDNKILMHERGSPIVAIPIDSLPGIIKNLYLINYLNKNGRKKYVRGKGWQRNRR